MIFEELFRVSWQVVQVAYCSQQTDMWCHFEGSSMIPRRFLLHYYVYRCSVLVAVTVQLAILFAALWRNKE